MRLPPSTHRAAFTLIEIMFVVGLIALVMATALPPFVRQLHKEPLRQAVNDILEACSTARARAVLKGTPMEVVFRAEDGHIAVRPSPVDRGREFVAGAVPEIVAPEDAAAGEIWGANLEREIIVRMLDVNMVDHMDAPTARVRFYPNGTSDELTLILDSPKGGARKITLEVVTALADVEDLR